MPRPISAVIDLTAMRRNLALAREHARGRFVWAVVKANAYGHGLDHAVRAFALADGLALLDLHEAQQARDAGWQRPILLLEGCFERRDLEIASALRLTAVVHTAEQIDLLEGAGLVQPIDVYLKLNTGMNRLGFAPGSATAAYKRLKSSAGVAQLTVMTHFANADRAAGAGADAGAGAAAAVTRQLQVLKSIAADWPEARSLANSAALFLRPEVGGDSVRPGIVLYGASTDESRSAAALGVHPAMTLRSRLIAVQDVAAGKSVGYGSRYAAPRMTRIGVVACGYADGYPRNAPDGTPVLVDGVRVPIAGRVSMDMITVDLTTVPHAGVGSQAELWGARIAVDEIANACGTVGYELLCAVGSRVPRVGIE